MGCDTVPGDCAGGSDSQFEFTVVLEDGIVDDALVEPVVLGLPVELWVPFPDAVPLAEPVVEHGAGVLVVALPVPVIVPDPVVEPFVVPMPAAPVVVDTDPGVELIPGVVPGVVVVLGTAPDGVLVVVLGVVVLDAVPVVLPDCVDGVVGLVWGEVACVPIVGLDCPVPGLAVVVEDPPAWPSAMAAIEQSAPASK